MRDNGEFGGKIGAKIGMKIAEKIGERVFGDGRSDSTAHGEGRTQGFGGRSSGRGFGPDFGGRRPDASMLDDMAGMIGGLAGIMADMRGQIAGDIRSRMQYAADRADLATRQDIDRLSAMIQSLAKRVEELEKTLSREKTAPAKPNAVKPESAKPSIAKTASPRKSSAAKFRNKSGKKSPKKSIQQKIQALTFKEPTIRNPKTYDERAISRQERLDLTGQWEKRLDALRMKGVARAQFCDDAGVAPAQLSRYLNGLNTPGWDAIERVERALAAAGV